MVAFRDPAIGLPIDSIKHLPQGLQDSLLRNQQNVTPIVFFVEWTTKLSEEARSRGTKERLLLITADSLNVYARDGTIKRRVKISDVAVLYISNAVVNNAYQQTSASSGGGATSWLASICLEVPKQFDIALDIRRESQYQCHAVITKLIRAMTTLRAHMAHQQKTVKSLQIVALRPGSLGVHADSELTYFRLKKAHASGPHPHGRKGPLLAPILPLVTEEMEKQCEADTKSQLDQTISDVAAEVHRYQFEHHSKPMQLSIAKTQPYAERLVDVEREAARLATKRAMLMSKAVFIEESMSAVEGSMTAARCEFVQQAASLDELRARHDLSIQEIRRQIEGCEQRTSKLELDKEGLQEVYLERMRSVLDPNKAQLEDSVAQQQHELSWREASLPTIDALSEEISLLQRSLEQLDEQESAHAKDKQYVAEQQELCDRLRRENEVLEKEAASALEAVRQSKDVTQQLVVQVSMTLATRTKTAAQLEDKRNAVAIARQDIVCQSQRLESLSEAAEYRRISTEVQRMEAIVSEDLQRQVDMHHGLSRSIVQLASQQVAEGEAVEQRLLDKLHRVQRSRSMLH